MNKISIAMAAAVAAGALSGCSPTNSDNVNFDPRKVVYSKDDRTDVCFVTTSTSRAGWFKITWPWNSNNRIIMATTPCTPKVEALIKRR